MKRKILIVYHTRLCGGNPPINRGHASSIMYSQMEALRRSGLYEACESMIVGVNGAFENVLAAGAIMPDDQKTMLVGHGPEKSSELPTLSTLRQWLGIAGHEDWFVFYHHCKCATRTDGMCRAWRGCMENVCVWNWRRCVRDLEEGFDTVGAHWMTPQRWPRLVHTPYWGGNFWWATASHLKALPVIPDNARNHDDFFLAEKWIGLYKTPHVRDYAPHWPNPIDCSKKVLA